MRYARHLSLVNSDGSDNSPAGDGGDDGDDDGRDDVVLVVTGKAYTAMDMFTIMTNQLQM